MKYILFEKRKATILDRPLMVVFTELVDHDKMAEAIGCLREGSEHSWTRPYYRPVSAGFTDGKSCYGRSETLNLESHPSDAEHL